MALVPSNLDVLIVAVDANWRRHGHHPDLTPAALEERQAVPVADTRRSRVQEVFRVAASAPEAAELPEGITSAVAWSPGAAEEDEVHAHARFPWRLTKLLSQRRASG